MEITRQLRCHAIFVSQRCPDGEKVAKDMRAAADEIEQLQADLDRKMGRRSDCKVCGEPVPFVGAVFCSEACWRKGVSDHSDEAYGGGLQPCPQCGCLPCQCDGMDGDHA